MFGKILYATDFSDTAKKAFRYVKGLRGAGAGDVVILHIVDKRGIDSMAVLTTIDVLGVEKGWMEDAAREMSCLENELKSEGFSVKTLIERGIPFKEIIRVASEENVSVIVVGSHGRTDIPEMLLGSVAEKVVRKAAKNVLVIKR